MQIDCSIMLRANVVTSYVYGGVIELETQLIHTLTSPKPS